VNKTHTLADDKLSRFNGMAYTAALKAAAEALDAQVVVLSQTYDGRALASRLSPQLEAALFSGVHELVQQDGGKWTAKRIVYSNKAIQTLTSGQDKLILTLKGNAMPPEENAQSMETAAFDWTPDDSLFVAKSTEMNRQTDKISLVDAEIVVSGGRGLKGPENWGMIEELAELLGAATACSKPVADAGWRPHHEHVGQTGIQIAPNLYFAVGISGAIQHLAGVSASKTIIVVNKDDDAPFFKAADYAIIGDAFEVIPKLIGKIKEKKGA